MLKLMNTQKSGREYMTRVETRASHLDIIYHGLIFRVLFVLLCFIFFPKLFTMTQDLYFDIFAV